MDAAEVDAVLSAAEQEVASGTSRLGPVGFWRAVAAAKRDPQLVERFAERIATIDEAAFANWAVLRLPAWLGTALAVLATAAGVVLSALPYYTEAPWNGLWLLLSAGILFTSVHGLGHLVVGGLAGIRFTSWFVGEWKRPQPGVKIDYASYLRTPARSRAWMHAAGAIASKAVPFLLLGPAFVAGTPWWSWAALLALGIGSIITDATLSVHSSDWMRFRREMRYAGG